MKNSDSEKLGNEEALEQESPLPTKTGSSGKQSSSFLIHLVILTAAACPFSYAPWVKPYSYRW